MYIQVKFFYVAQFDIILNKIFFCCIIWQYLQTFCHILGKKTRHNKISNVYKIERIAELEFKRAIALT